MRFPAVLRVAAIAAALSSLVAATANAQLAPGEMKAT
jgi:hypothetical protein